ncbi:NADH-ubiquinone oxidoreductase chain 5-like [Oncorhynchus keta]|uniref:NADH-ubiquinone oxidoreductase chain 5-like n=1 Tax=Oncorhynchus keta TaxID=8018 RepID=UPI00227A8348|nr:NADH-ubiquinone oxidoreductase chain 5-like [Oncorhynchus keta]XP_052324031.1 NADH-ubiquinone oxidoreductase chain 5-like [Oncorhynchus keta]XP_052324032.1 NADH-ubiquinone oxidoreductase chain 5-like [Oncorhynchus keta]XP_052324033.1 NADH-ubiquinone oxidoreductase chain 5-like [Oncorhynchus keta]XP_052324034.1 NADH-ubiquinone oxidoreductase chain 5-like [Oncorhynchus keta]XP_052324035.1 NADH-ubiquinone oxidoreductase chain 5-like [Oncorhynchus keta]XP_052324036.1 NADH-ubiquinone oxidoreduc
MSVGVSCVLILQFVCYPVWDCLFVIYVCRCILCSYSPVRLLSCVGLFICHLCLSVYLVFLFSSSSVILCGIVYLSSMSVGVSCVLILQFVCYPVWDCLFVIYVCRCILCSYSPVRLLSCVGLFICHLCLSVYLVFLFSSSSVILCGIVYLSSMSVGVSCVLILQFVCYPVWDCLFVIYVCRCILCSYSPVRLLSCVGLFICHLCLSVYLVFLFSGSSVILCGIVYLSSMSVGVSCVLILQFVCYPVWDCLFVIYVCRCILCSYSPVRLLSCVGLFICHLCLSVYLVFLFSSSSVILCWIISPCVYWVDRVSCSPENKLSYRYLLSAPDSTHLD